MRIHPIKGAKAATRAFCALLLAMVAMLGLIVGMLLLVLVMLAMTLAMCCLAPFVLVLLVVEIPLTIASLFVRGDFGWTVRLLERTAGSETLDSAVEYVFGGVDLLMDGVDRFMDLLEPLMDRAMDRVENLA